MVPLNCKMKNGGAGDKKYNKQRCKRMKIVRKKRKKCKSNYRYQWIVFISDDEHRLVEFNVLLMLLLLLLLLLSVFQILGPSCCRVFFLLNKRWHLSFYTHFFFLSRKTKRRKTKENWKEERVEIDLFSFSLFKEEKKKYFVVFPLFFF